ncbi:uncharacterized protein LOC100840044 [Brachypodium distachyon]|uniref:Uncharacterized protein n=1 Tax=Brachypodium distachyon TaxID=15368 RepID=I1IS78_BRADI|nr:uncharacterized protein LOC100840044 [Brachypodium distachyon]PNT65020.1 hypothetical protein BRADI_4g36267v3 [Brachypodium distachyon]|eukprot:XP_003576773.2 uncharacterized protein LOC100840044 [Brachypodium distachyon]
MLAMARPGGVAQEVLVVCFFVAVVLALGGVMGQEPPQSPTLWLPPPMPVQAYADGRPIVVDRSKPNRIFSGCNDDFGNPCVTQCSDACPQTCQFFSCSYCETTCRCLSRPGTACGDPSFTGGDGNTFYFHGRKDRDFCIVSDTDLHINAHFIGNHNPANKRTFTWIQALGLSFGEHRLYIGATGAVVWEEDEDHIEISFDGEPIDIDTANNARWVSKVLPTLSVTRIDNFNSINVELAGVFRISASAVPITDEESKIHKYGKTDKDSLVHLDLHFKFLSLTDSVGGVLGQTYRPDYINKMNVTAKMPIMGGAPKYLSSGLFSTDCAVSKFRRGGEANKIITSAS